MINLKDIIVGTALHDFLSPYIKDPENLKILSGLNLPPELGVKCVFNEGLLNSYWMDSNRYIERAANLDKIGFIPEKIVFRIMNKPNLFFEIYSKYDGTLYVMAKRVYQKDMNLFQAVDIRKYLYDFYAFVKSIYVSEHVKMGIA